MNMPGFTAEVSLSQTNNHCRLAAGGSLRSNRKATEPMRALLDADSAVVPAQIDWERVSRFLSSRGGMRQLWDAPVCPLGQRAVWVEHPPTEKYCETKKPFFNQSTMRWEWKIET